MSAYSPNQEPGAPATPATPTPPSPRVPTTGRHVGNFNFRLVNLLLLIPLIGTLPPMFYNSVNPQIGGMPFFYWYQLLWIPISVTVTYVVYRATRGDR
jgi:hypothetical protein